MSQSINGVLLRGDPSPSQPTDSLPSFQKESDINHPGPSHLFEFLDIYEPAILDSLFMIPPPGWRQIFGTSEIWWDLPANRHSQGCNLSFADGHVERWRWTTPKQWVGDLHHKVFGQDIAGDGDMKDFRRMQKSVRPETRFTDMFQPE